SHSSSSKHQTRRYSITSLYYSLYVIYQYLHSFPTRRSSDLILLLHFLSLMLGSVLVLMLPLLVWLTPDLRIKKSLLKCNLTIRRSEERFSRNAETDLVCRLLLEKKK